MARVAPGDEPVADQSHSTRRWRHCVEPSIFGFHDLNRLRQDTNLDPLRSRADFQLMAMDLAFPASPFSQ